MIALLGASVIYLTALQASIAAPTEAFRGCLREAASKATHENVSGDAIEAYLKNACSVQMSTLKGAVVAFRVKNGMAKKSALADADMTVDDYVATPADNYKFMASQNAPTPPQQKPATIQPASTPPKQ